MKLTHPDTRRVINVREDMAEPYLTQGWVRANTTPKKATAAKTAAPSE